MKIIITAFCDNEEDKHKINTDNELVKYEFNSNVLPTKESEILVEASEDYIFYIRVLSVTIDYVNDSALIYGRLYKFENKK